MKLAVSNIAWTKEEEDAVAKKLQQLGVKYVEVAPTKMWDDPTITSDDELEKYKDFWKSYDIEIVAFQSMLFNRPDLKIFESEQIRKETLNYLEKFITIAPKLGAEIMVFGSPKNRQKDELGEYRADEIAKLFFQTLGDVAQRNQTCFCIEPNPTAYACDFIINAGQGIDFVNEVGNPGFGLHLDIAGMTLAKDNVVDSIKAANKMIKHFHISAPYLEQVEEREDVDYKGAAEALSSIGYNGYVSIEMKPSNSGDNITRVEKAVRFSQSIFA